MLRAVNDQPGYDCETAVSVSMVSYFNTLKTFDKIMGFSVHLHLFYNLYSSDTNYLHIQIKKNPTK